jgi:hypothetical protein
LLIPSRNRLTDRDSSHGLCFPTAHTESKILVRKACQPIAVTSAGFGYPLDAFIPSTPCRFCFTPAALMGFTLRSFLLAKGIWQFPAGRTHIPLAAAQEHPKAIFCGLATSVSGPCSFRESLAIKPVFSGLIAGCSPGFRSSRARGQEPCSGFRPNSSRMLDCTNGACATRTTEYRSAPTWIGRAATASRSERPNDPRRVPAPVTPEHSNERNSRAMGSPHVASRVAADRPTGFASSLRSTGAAQQST